MIFAAPCISCWNGERYEFKVPELIKSDGFILGVKTYFAMSMPIYLEKIAQIPQKNNVAPYFDALVTSSEVIESIFGKLKHRALKDPNMNYPEFYNKLNHH